MTCNSRRISIVLLALIVVASAVCLDRGRAQFEKKKEVKGVQTVPIQPPPGSKTPDAGMNPDGFLNGGISLPKDEKNRGQAIEAAIDYIGDENWVVAVERLQKLLEIDEDVFVRLKRKNVEGKEIFVWVSAKQEADRLIGTLPPAGLDFYKATYGAQAADMLKKAKKTGDPALLAQVVKRFAHTDAGGEAVKLLADYHLDRGNYPGALFCYSRLLNREGADKLPPEVLAKAWIAAKMSPSSGSNTSLAGNMLSAEELGKRLREQARGELKFGEQAVALEDFEGYVATLQRPGFDQNATDATVFRATPNRANQLVGGPAFMSAARRWRMYHPEDEEGGSQESKETSPLETMSDQEEKSATHTKIREALAHLSGKNQPALPAFAPITITVNKDGKKKPLLIYKNYWGLVARDLKNGEVAFAAPSSWSMQRMFGSSRGDSSSEKVTHLKQWLGQYQNQYPQIVFENSTVGTLSTDGQFVYAIEDLAVPPLPQTINNGMVFPGGRMPNNGGGLPTNIQKAIDHNKLQAYSLDKASGKLVWELPPDEDDGKGPFSDCYFLGPPLPLGGKLYLLVDKQQELRLICLDPAVLAADPKNIQGAIVSSQALGTTQERMPNDVFRRITAAHLAYGEGILVCSTNAGAVFGINLLENSLVWAYPYREKSDQPKPEPQQGRVLRGRRGMIVGNNMVPAAPLSNHEKHWKACCPIIADGKVIFTAPDARSLHCINLRDGSPVWRKPKLDNDLYLGNVHNGTVLVVGKKNVRGLSLATGENLWTTDLEETGLLPSGLGIGSDNIYYLPLASVKDANKKPQIWAIDMDKGKVIGSSSSRPRTPGEKDYDVPGNLLFYEGDVISLTTEEITVYPQLKRKIAEIDAEIAKNPNDPVNLTERGDLRLAQGELGDAIEDLNAALKNKPDAQTRERARGKLYDALTSYIADHFNEAEKYLKEYEELCNLDVDNAPASKKAELRAEQRRRRATFLWLVGKGREEQGQLVEAFEKYQQFGAEAGKQSELIEAVDERQVKAAPDVWSRGRILAMMSKATPEERAPLEKLIADKWAKLRETNDLGELRAFVRMFGSASDAGKEARLQLVERLMEQRDGNDEHPLLEAELELNQFRTGQHKPELAARATEALARLYTRKGLLEDAAHCYRQLGGEFAKVQVRDGKTGRQIYDDDAATDKRLIPYLDDPQPLGSVKFGTGKKESGSFEKKQVGGPQFFQFEHSGEDLPFFRHHIVGVAYTGSNTESFKLFDRKQEEENGAPKEIWASKLTFSGFIPSLNAQGAMNQVNVNFSARIPYQTMGHLIVLPAGRMLYGIDPVSRRVLWERDLAAGGSGPVPVDPRNPRGIAIQATIPDPHDGSLWVVYPDNWATRVGQAGPLRGQVICVQTRDALTALDPLTGRSLWSRSDINTDVNLRTHLFADEEYVFVVEEDNTGVPHPTRVFRAADGITVKAPDFAAIFQKRRQIFGRYILLSESGPGNHTTVRLYDPITGADVWKQNYAARSLVARSDDPSLAGVVEPDGKFHVVDLRTRKEVMAGQLDKEDEADQLQDLRNAQSVHLLFDRQNFYFACQGQGQRGLKNNNVPKGGLVVGNNAMLSGVMTQQGMRTLPVNGYLYAFERGSGEMAWNTKVENQFLILDQFGDSPLVLFATRQQKVENQGGRMQVRYPVEVLGIEKRSGKTVFGNKNVFTSPNGNSFFAVRIDTRASTVELLSHQTRVVFHPALDKNGKEAKDSKPAADVPAPRSGTRLNRPAVDRVRIREFADPLPSR